MAATFHPFPKLPAELRIQIWTLAAGPRILHIRVFPKTPKMYPELEDLGYASPTPAPAVLHACRESRLIAPYQKAFFTSTPVRGGNETKYIWVNFQQDMICLADYQLKRLGPYRADIERLRFSVPTGQNGDFFYSYFFDKSHEILRDFSALRELHISVEESFLIWGSAVCGSGYAKCPRENVRFLDTHTGLLLTGPQLEMAYNWSWQKGGKVRDVDDIDEEISFELRNFCGLNLQELAEID
ncbi:hypothetical protein GQX73_g7083 [Xylaria multiplex]|uniref:2EXR domain-containing protein n=1 Tax=Xylaria multiplex TaxID=323545 RepID=A0A7C8N4M1_9PEZI|nr:hypothetical protein GQX73_g7083 [Xylaria multiplex]